MPLNAEHFQTQCSSKAEGEESWQNKLTGAFGCQWINSGSLPRNHFKISGRTPKNPCLCACAILKELFLWLTSTWMTNGKRNPWTFTPDNCQVLFYYSDSQNYIVLASEVFILFWKVNKLKQNFFSSPPKRCSEFCYRTWSTHVIW